MTADAFDMASLDQPPPAEAVPQPADPWLARRALGFGASDAAVLLVALGMRPLDVLPSYLHADVKVTNRTAGRPRIIAQKAGIVEPRKRGSAAAQGTARELELLNAWRKLVERDQAGPDAALLDPSTVQHASEMPRWAWPYPDRASAGILAASLDGWCSDVFGALVVIECKCSVRPYEGTPEHHALQVQAQMAAVGAASGVIVEGCGWAAEWHANDGPIRTYAVERCERTITEIRAACLKGWRMVEELRAEVTG